jgi:streptomycin 6-kinase
MERDEDDFARNIVGVHGDAGVEWLARLPSLVHECARRWSLEVLPPFRPRTFSHAAPAIRGDGAEVVLKLGVPSPELLTEIDALRLFDGRGSVRLLDADPEWGVLLLERLRPGASLAGEEDDRRATSIAARVMRRLWRPVPARHSFPTVETWGRGLERLRARFEGGTGPFPRDLVEAAEVLFRELAGSMGELVVLHGDLHHGNILSAERESWLSLDPKGVIGEPAYECGALLRNPMPDLLDRPHPERILARRVDELVETLQCDRDRLVGWGVAQAVLSAWWDYEDEGGAWDWSIRCAEHLASLRHVRR